MQKRSSSPLVLIWALTMHNQSGCVLNCFGEFTAVRISEAWARAAAKPGKWTIQPSRGCQAFAIVTLKQSGNHVHISWLCQKKRFWSYFCKKHNVLSINSQFKGIAVCSVPPWCSISHIHFRVLSLTRTHCCCVLMVVWPLFWPLFFASDDIKWLALENLGTFIEPYSISVPIHSHIVIHTIITSCGHSCCCSAEIKMTGTKRLLWDYYSNPVLNSADHRLIIYWEQIWNWAIPHYSSCINTKFTLLSAQSWLDAPGFGYLSCKRVCVCESASAEMFPEPFVDKGAQLSVFWCILLK